MCEECTYKCKYCTKEFNCKQSLGAHVIHCKLNPNNHIYEFSKRRSENAKLKNPLLTYELICENCGKVYKISELKNNFDNGRYKHTCSRHCASVLSAKKTNKEEKNKKISEKSKNKKSPIKGKHYENNKLVANSEERNKELFVERKKICKYCGKEFIIDEKIKKGYVKNYNFCSDECKHLFFSELAKKSKFGGYVKNSIKSHKSGTYKGIHCDSSWELAYLVFCLEHDIEIKRCNEKREYIINGVVKNYFPDFIINKNQIIEIKGYHDDISKQKQLCNPDIKFVFKNDLIGIIKYVTEKYGKNFWEKLYE